MLATLLALALALGLAAPTGPVNPDPDELLRQADDALRGVESLSYAAERTCVGWLATQSPHVRGTVLAQRLDDGGELPWRVRIDAQSAEPVGEAQRVEAAYDGEVAAALLHGESVYLNGVIDSSLGPVLDGGGRIAAWMVLWESVIGPRARGEIEYSLIEEGQATVAGEVCDVIRLALYELGDIPEYETWVFLGQDRLPRRFDVTYYDDLGDAAIVTLTLDNVTKGATVPEGAFTLAVPEGFEVVEYESGGMFGAEGFEEGPAPAVEVGQPAPDWSLADANNNTSSLVDYRGMIVVMDFWATWCPPCREAMPVMQALHEKYKGRPVAILGVNCWEEGDPAEFMRENNYTYRLMLDADEVADAYGVEGIPTLYVIGEDGTVLYHHVGFSDDLRDELTKVIDEALAR